ncbi:MAG: TPM domain-containing protein [bacterium]|nr:TPM domain-containing protein [bacterium]
MKTRIESILAIICSIVLIGAASPAKAEQGTVKPFDTRGRIGTTPTAENSYPQPQDNYVNDYAGLVTERHAGQIRKRFGKLERKRGVEAVVVTINSIRDYPTGDTTIESFATNLFNTWGIGHTEKNDGVLILVAVQDRECRIELGAGYGRRYDLAMQSVIDKKMIPYFKKGDYSAGIYKGACAAVGKLTGKVPWFPILIGLLIVVVAILLVRGLVRAGRRVEVPPAAAPPEVVQGEEVEAHGSAGEGRAEEVLEQKAGWEEAVPRESWRTKDLSVPMRKTPTSEEEVEAGRVAQEKPRREEHMPKERWWQRDLFGRSRPALNARKPARSTDSGEGWRAFFDILGGLLDIFGSGGGGGGGGGGFGGGSSFGGGASGRW